MTVCLTFHSLRLAGERLVMRKGRQILCGLAGVDRDWQAGRLDWPHRNTQTKTVSCGANYDRSLTRPKICLFLLQRSETHDEVMYCDSATVDVCTFKKTKYVCTGSSLFSCSMFYQI